MWAGLGAGYLWTNRRAAPDTWSKTGESATWIDFADDVALLADSWMVMAALLMKMEEVTQRFGIIISAKKSKILYIGSLGGRP